MSRRQVNSESTTDTIGERIGNSRSAGEGAGTGEKAGARLELAAIARASRTEVPAVDWVERSCLKLGRGKPAACNALVAQTKRLSNHVSNAESSE